MEGTIETMAAQIVPAIGVLMATLVSVGTAYAIKWLKLKTGSEALMSAGEIVAATVNDLTASAVKDLKAKSADGKLTLNEAAKIKSVAKSRIKNQMPNAVAKAVVLAIGDLDVFLEGKIEQEVSKQKVNASL